MEFITEKIIDPSVASQINPNSLRKFIEIVDKCLKPNGASRPKMLDICWDLKYTLQLQQTAVGREAHEHSAIDASLEFSSRPFQRLPSNNDFVPLTRDIDGSHTTASRVFSELRIDGGR
ncbi:putative receptor-like protein kinase [Corchorus capsularis]|uniref:Putative receptor-like protein kinase n=1 Tax=Corchorus capsularis TaxID=210143 RepID=A0A1R3HM54_COCAP|nr:putative receptor-like protein kinase [Corchorus capsularis]